MVLTGSREPACAIRSQPFSGISFSPRDVWRNCEERAGSVHCPTPEVRHKHIGAEGEGPQQHEGHDEVDLGDGDGAAG